VYICLKQNIILLFKKYFVATFLPRKRAEQGLWRTLSHGLDAMIDHQRHRTNSLQVIDSKTYFSQLQFSTPKMPRDDGFFTWLCSVRRVVRI
jgi:hypothetical protein